MRYVLLVTGPAYGTQHASSALLFAKTLLTQGHELKTIFFHREGVLNANKFFLPSSNEYDIVRAWQSLKDEYSVKLQICISSSLRRGIKIENNLKSNLQIGFEVTGLTSLVCAIINSDRLIQF